MIGLHPLQLTIVGGVDSLVDQGAYLSPLIARFCQGKAATSALGLSSFRGLTIRRSGVLSDGEHTFLDLPFTGKFETVAPSLYAIGFDFEVQAIGIGQFVGVVLGFRGSTFGIGQHRYVSLSAIPAFSPAGFKAILANIPTFTPDFNESIVALRNKKPRKPFAGLFGASRFSRTWLTT
jgi:hypothetical protein